MIANLLFDLGGVIMDIKRANCVEAFKELGMHEPERFLGEYSQKGPFGDLESGMITPEQFRAFVRSQLPAPVSDARIDAAFNKFLIGIPLERLRQLQLLRADYGIYMLSNTNLIMWNQDIDAYFRTDGLTREEYFDGIVTSFEAKCMKPDPRIFLYAVDKLHIRPEETLFLDDSERNLEGAAALGFRTLHVPPGSEFYELLRKELKI